MFTPAISASSTSPPDTIIANAFSTHVCVPPFLNWCPFAEETTRGLALFGASTVGAWPNTAAGETEAAATAAPACTN